MLERSAETLEAHVVIDGDYEIRPGDAVLVRDPPTEIGFGEKIEVRRIAETPGRASEVRGVDTPSPETWNWPNSTMSASPTGGSCDRLPHAHQPD